jgi:transcription initiation factor TFIIIB Brf1 subunit/transcription initiation factor TFIIB
MASTYVRKSIRNFTFTGELLNEERQRILNGESQRKVAAALGSKESTLRKRMKAVSTE